MHIIPSFLVDKASCTRQFESELSLHSPASLFPIKEGIFSNPSVSLSKGSSTSNQAFSIVFTTPSVPLVGDRNLRRKDVTALLGARNRYAIRLAGHQSPRQVVRDGTARLLWRSACNYIAESGCMERVSSIDAMKLSISVFFLDYSLSFFISSAGFSTNFCSAWLAVGAMRLLPP